jgi:hypothetical protein
LTVTRIALRALAVLSGIGATLAVAFLVLQNAM